MKKKLIAILVLALVVSTVSVFALGIGLQGGYGNSAGSGVAVSFKLDQSPLIFSAFVDPFGGSLTVGGTADMWAINGNLAGPVNYFAGLGVGAGVRLGDVGYIRASARAFAGINAFFLDGFVEPYVQVAYAPTIGIWFNSEPLEVTLGGYSVASGVRFWL